MHWYLAKPQTIVAGGPVGAVSPPGGLGQCLGEGMGAKPPNNCFCTKHAKMVIVRVNIG